MRLSALPTPETSDPRPPMRQVLIAATARLERAELPSPRADAEMLAAHACGIDRTALALATEFPAAALAQFWALVERRAEREPLQHLTGETGFRHLLLTVKPGVFIPRPESEMVAEAAIEAARSAPGSVRNAPVPVRVVDLCAGAGGIAASVAHEVPGARVWAIDIDPEAVALTEANAARNECAVVAAHADVRDRNLLAELAGTVDVVVSNPPYIPYDSEPIDVEVRNYDPPAALYGGGQDGLEIPAAVIDRARTLLRPGGVLVVEHGDDQGAAMRDLVARGGGFEGIHTREDLTKRDRMVVAMRAEVAH